MTARPLSRVRSVLFAPAVRPDFLAKLPDRGADLVVIDCEDATPPDAKSSARDAARDVAPELARRCPVAVRINPPGTSWFDDDVRSGLVPELAAVMVPKVEDLAGLDLVAATLDAAGLGDLGVIAGIETALGVADARLTLAHPQVVAAYFGAEDFIADMGGQRTPANAEVAHARASVALDARLAGVPVLDQVVADFRDAERFEREAAEARAMGYAGKLCIHPGQVASANAAWTPSDDEVNRARRLLAAYERATGDGLAAIDFEGQMVDAPLAAQARRVLELAGG